MDNKACNEIQTTLAAVLRLQICLDDIHVPARRKMGEFLKPPRSRNRDSLMRQMRRKHIPTEHHLLEDDLGPSGDLKQPVARPRRSNVGWKRKLVPSSEPEDLARWEEVGELLVGLKSGTEGSEL